MFYKLIYILFIFLSFNSNIIGQPVTTYTDSISTANIENNEPVKDDFSPMQMFAFLLFIGFMLLCVGLGITAALAIMALMFLLVTSGVLSASIMYGFYQRSFLKGFKVFVIALSGIFGAIIGGLSWWLLLSKFSHWLNEQNAIIYGSLLGFIAGSLIGILAYTILKKIIVYFKNKMDVVK